MYQPTDNYFATLHSLVLSGEGEPKAETSSQKEQESPLPINGKQALAALKLLEQAYPKDAPEQIAGKVRYLVAHYQQVLAEARKKLMGTGEKSEPSPQVREALKELHYKHPWKFASYITPLKAELSEVLETLDEKDLSDVRKWAERCLKLTEVGAKTEHQMAKQINTANAKMMTVLDETLRCTNLGSDDQLFLKNAKQRINARIEHATETNGADFKSCDSAGIDLAVQLERAEQKCRENGGTSTQSSQDDY